MFFTGKRIVLFSILFMLILSVRVFSAFPGLVEAYYSNGIYPQIGSFLRGITGKLPFSIGDIVYGGVIIWLLVKVINFLWNYRNEKKNIRSRLPVYSWNVFMACCIVYLWFNVFWGLNYNRLPMMERFSHPVFMPGKQELVDLMDFLHEKMKEEYDVAVSERKKLEDSRYVCEQAAKAYEILSEKEPESCYSPVSIKTSLFSHIGNYLGYTGYYNPFTGEAQINGTIPEFSRPFVACHEIAHQLGWAKENEANFTGFKAAIASDLASFRYAAYFEMYFYSRRILYRIDSLLVKDMDGRLHPGVKEDYNRLVHFHQSFQNPVETVIDKLYARYLKANNQPSGKEAYAEGVLLLLSWKKENELGIGN
jgi:hypothetical protein